MSGDPVDAARLRASLDTLSERGRRSPEAAIVRPTVTARLEKDTAVVARFRQYGTDWTLRSDEAEERGGHERGPSPIRYLLVSMASCLLGWSAKTWAAAGAEVHELRVEMRAVLDLRGEHLVDDVPAHPSWFVADLSVADDTDADTARNLACTALARCPTTALVRRGADVHLVVRHPDTVILDERPADLIDEVREESTP